MNKTTIQGDNINDIYKELIKTVLNTPQYEASPRGQKIKEILNCTLILTNPKNCLITLAERKLNYKFALIEKLEFASGEHSPSRINFYNKHLAPFMNENNTFDGNYADRLPYWYQYIIQLLKKDPDTRQAVIPIYGIQDRHQSKDIPCTLSLQFFIRENKLHLIVNMRSNDVYLGVPYDTQSFCFIQEMIASILNIGVGTYQLNAGSMHIYERDFETLRKVAESTEVIDKQTYPMHVNTYEQLKQQINMFWVFEYIARERNEKIDPLYLGYWLKQYIKNVNL